MINAVYQATVTELETVLSARVVSRSLNEGLKQAGKSPETVDAADMETILKSHIYRQLQVAMPVEQAKDKINTILANLNSLDDGVPAENNAFLEQQGKSIEELQEAMRPFNLYFEWAEMQKLRAQMQLIETEHEAGREAAQLISSARAQLLLVEQKLEDQLVAQSQELGKLEEAQEELQSLGGAKLRRLGRLVKQVEEAQSSRQLAGAELERARKLVNDLRQKMPAPAEPEAAETATIEAVEPAEPRVESSVEISEDSSDFAALIDDTISIDDTASLQESPEEAVEGSDLDDDDNVSFEGLLLDLDDDEASEEAALLDTSDLIDDSVSDERIKQLKLEEEGYELNALAQNYAELCKYSPDLQSQLEQAQAQLESGESLGESLGELRQNLEEAKVNLIATLKHDLDFKQNSLADFDDDLDYQDLKQHILIAQGVLSNDGLPFESDIRQIRDRYRLLEQQAQELRAQRAEQAAEFQKSLQVQADTIHELEGSFERHSSDVDADAYAQLQQNLERLEKAQEEGRLERDTLQQAREAAEILESKAAERAEGQEKEKAKIRSLIAQVRSLPLLNQLENQQKQLLARLEEQLETSTTGLLLPSDFETSKKMVVNLKEDVQTVYRHRIRDMRETAQLLESTQTLQQLDNAESSLQDGMYPELGIISQSLSEASKVRLTEQLSEVYQLEEERTQLVSIDETNENSKEFATALAEAHEQLEAGQLVDNSRIGHAWSLLEAMRQTHTSQLTSFTPRLDKAIATFEPLAKLNTDDSVKVSRILRHLDGQRESFQKVSVAMQSNLEQMLSEAEALMTPLQSEYEATRDIAGKLVSGNVLDDVLSIFGTSDASPSEALTDSEPEKERTLTEVRSGNQVLNEWVDDYLEERGIRGAIVFNSKGDVLAGRTLLEPKTLFDAVKNLEEDWRSLGQELDVGVPELLTIEVDDDIMIIAFPSSHDCIVILLEMPSMLNLILNKLRRDIPAISDILSGPAFS